MKDRDESQIRSFNIKANSSDEQAFLQGASKEKRSAWVVLICFDGGFSSQKPERITAASFNQFFEESGAVITGTVKEGLPKDIEPFYVEYPVHNLKDFSPLPISCKIPLIKRLKNAIDILDDIYNKRVSLKEGIEKIIALRPPSSILDILSKISDIEQKEIKKENKAGSSAKIDSILSMVNISDSSNETEKSSSFNPLIEAISELDSESESIREKILLCKNYTSDLIEKICSIVLEQPFFRAYYSSWECLKTLLKIVGRESKIIFYVYSATYDAAERNLPKILNFCIEEEGTPDFIIWDYPVTTDTATMEQLEYIGSIAERYKTLILTSLYYNDELYNRILKMEPLSSVIGENTFIPFRRLQNKEDVSRCLALFAPDAVSKKSSGVTVRYSGAWLFSFLWASSFLETNIPFYLQGALSSGLFDGLIFPRISKDTLFDAHLHGINLLVPESPLAFRVISDNADSSYGNLFFNLIVNRTARLAANWIDRVGGNSLALEQYLKKELMPDGILSSIDALSVETTEGEVVVTVDSEIKISNFNIKFQFSFGK